jgi:hypothetical protein
MEKIVISYEIRGHPLVKGRKPSLSSFSLPTKQKSYMPDMREA